MRGVTANIEFNMSLSSQPTTVHVETFNCATEHLLERFLAMINFIASEFDLLYNL